MDISELGLNIKNYRGKKGWSLNKLKQESGIGYATLHDIESGKTQNLGSTNLEKVAKALGATTNELLGIDILEVTVDDIEKTFDSVLLSDELKLDGKVITEDEREELKDFFMMAVNKIRRRRNKQQNDNSSNL